MTPTTLRVRASGPGLVQNHEKLANGINAFIGKRYGELPGTPGAWAFINTDEPETVPYRAEYVHALKAGDLEPADQATAEAFGLKFVAPKKAPSAPSGGE